MIFKVNKNDSIEVRHSLGGGYRVVVVNRDQVIFLEGGFRSQLHAACVAMGYYELLV